VTQYPGIRELEVIPLVAPLSAPFHWATGTASVRRTTLVRVKLDDGTQGWGETLDAHAPALLTPNQLDFLRGHSSDVSSAELEQLASALEARGATTRAAGAAAGAVETACCDARARHLGLPLAKLLSDSPHPRVPVYASGLYYSEKANMAEEAAGYLAAGFDAFKMKIGRVELARDALRVAAVREAIGSRRLMADANGAYDLTHAVAASAMLRDASVVWLEEPFDPRDQYAYEALSKLESIPIALGESLSYAELVRVLKERTVHWLQPNVAVAGGVTRTLALLQAAVRAGANCALHAWGTPVMTAAALHVAAAAQRPVLVEIDQTPNPLRRVASDPARRPDSGQVALPVGPGLGIEVDQDQVRRFQDRSLT